MCLRIMLPEKGHVYTNSINYWLKTASRKCSFCSISGLWEWAELALLPEEAPGRRTLGHLAHPSLLISEVPDEICVRHQPIRDISYSIGSGLPCWTVAALWEFGNEEETEIHGWIEGIRLRDCGGGTLRWSINQAKLGVEIQKEQENVSSLWFTKISGNVLYFHTVRVY